MGTLAPGSWADFILVDRDIFTIPAEQLWQTTTLETWINGQQRYSK